MKLDLCFAMLVLATLAGQPGYAQATAHAFDGGTSEMIQSISIPPRTGAPFSATVVTVWTRLLEDGTKVTIKNHRLVARDSAGRTFQERRFFTADGDTQPTELGRLEYYDATRSEFYDCNPRTHVCLVSTWSRPQTVPVDTRPVVALRNGTVRRESLGQTVMSNLDVIGSREIKTTNPGQNGYTRPEPTIKEFWYSPHLDINLVVKRFEPRGGAQDFQVENLNLTEPDPNLFTPPKGYTIVHTSRY